MAADPVVALMSIRPRFAQAILEGVKLVELRRVPLKRPITHVVIYETAPTAAIVGVFGVGNVVERTPRAVWDKYNGTSGLTKREFDAYFTGKHLAIVIEVGEATRLSEAVRLSDLSIRRPPQSFMYLPLPLAERFLKETRSHGNWRRSTSLEAGADPCS